MARIQIPLDLLTSRLNLSDRFASVQSQSLTTRFANLRPMSEFFDVKRLSKPANFSETQSRVNFNLGHFSSNYAAVFLMLSVYALLTNFALIFLIILVVGGMWGIGKLGGQDLDIGVIRATTAQLYTALLIIAVPLFFLSSPFKTILWLIGFFWGGGLGGRPRSPKRVPSWGRPPGAKGSKQRKKWEREQALWLEQKGFRIEELDSDETDTPGVSFDFGGKGFTSDVLKFTGVEPPPQVRPRRNYSFDGTDSDSEKGRSGSDDDGNESAVSARQIALRDKEEALVQSALARIRRAQEKGKREVKLNPDEVAALERRRKKLQSAATASKAKNSSSGGGGSGGERRRRRDTDMVTVPIVQPQSRQHSDKYREQSPVRAGSGGPGMLVEGPGGVVTYAPIGTYPPASPQRNSPTRPRSSTSLGHQSRNTPPYASEYAQVGRHLSDETRPTSAGSPRLALPHEEGWIAGSRRSSVSSQYSYDPFEYQTSAGQVPPIPSHYTHAQGQGRRIVSGPPQVSYSSVRRSPPMATASSSSKMRYSTAASASDSNLSRRRGEEEDITDSLDSQSNSEDDESDDFGHGVPVEPERPMIVPAKKQTGGSGGRKKGRR